jgi:carbamoyl-phosphate synthase small subunit
MKALIALEDGTVFEGKSFTGAGEAIGEVVFNTSMTGYQEILTDPSYKSQIVTMTYPLIGNYGINEEDMESSGIHMEAFLVKEYNSNPSNFRSTSNVADFLKRFNILGVQGIDTRSLAKHIRVEGAMKAAISTLDTDKNSLIKKARNWPGLVGQNMVEKVTCNSPYAWSEQGPIPPEELATSDRLKVVALDFGLKFNQLRLLHNLGCSLLIVPAQTSASEILSLKPDGIFLSNGPGDPAGVPGVAETVKSLLGSKPIFGICLGHQILGRALGGKTYKLKFGHRGANQPVKDLETEKIEITSQNHGFCIDPDSFNSDEVKITHLNLNDNSVEGIQHLSYPAFSVQYHPENAPGPRDALYLFDRFIKMMQEFK